MGPAIEGLNGVALLICSHPLLARAAVRSRAAGIRPTNMNFTADLLGISGVTLDDTTCGSIERRRGRR
jgi:hypothetical protein